MRVSYTPFLAHDVQDYNFFSEKKMQDLNAKEGIQLVFNSLISRFEKF